MSLYDYEISKKLAGMDFPFYSLVMAAYRQADTENQTRLRDAWPEVVAELQERYDAPGGLIPSDRTV